MQPNIPIPTGKHGIQPCGIRCHRDSNTLHVTWISEFTTDAIHAYINYQKSTDGGFTWLPEPVRVDAGDEDWRRYGGVWSPPGGPIFASWSERTGLEWPSWAICSMSLDGGMTWSDSPAVANPGTGEANTCALSGNDRDGSVYICWNNQITGGIFFARGGVQESISEDPGPSSRWITATPCPASGLVQIDIPEELRQSRVPRLLLQPLVDAALRRSADPSKALVAVKLIARADHGRLVLRVSDQSDDNRIDVGDIGLDNAKQRIRHMYGEQYGLRREAAVLEGSDTVVELPLSTEKT